MTEPSESTSAGAGTRRARLRLAAAARGVPLLTIVTSVVVVATAYLLGKLLYRLRDVLLLLLVAGFVAMILNPLVSTLQRWRWLRRRGWAVGVVTVGAGLSFVGLAAAFGYPLVHAVAHFSNHLPAYLKDAQTNHGWVGHLVRRFHLESWVARNSPKLQNLAQSLAKPALSLGKGALSVLAQVATIFVLVIMILLEAPRLHASVLAAVPPERADSFRRVTADINRTVVGYMFGDFLTSVIAGVIVFVTLTVLGVPYAFLWALWVALVDFLPMVGGALAGIPTVLFATAHSLTSGIVMLVVFLVYQQVENHVLNPIVMSRTVRVDPLLILISVMVGASIGSWLGGAFGAFAAALLAIPVAGVLQVIGRDVWRATASDSEPATAPSTSPAPLTEAAVSSESRR